MFEDLQDVRFLKMLGRMRQVSRSAMVASSNLGV